MNKYEQRRLIIISLVCLIIGIGTGAMGMSLVLRSEIPEPICSPIPDKFALVSLPSEQDISTAVLKKSGIESIPFTATEVGNCLFVSMRPTEFGKFHVAVFKLTENRKGWKLIKVIPVTYTDEDINKELPIVEER